MIRGLEICPPCAGYGADIIVVVGWIIFRRYIGITPPDASLDIIVVVVVNTPLYDFIGIVVIVTGAKEPTCIITSLFGIDCIIEFVASKSKPGGDGHK